MSDATKHTQAHNSTEEAATSSSKVRAVDKLKYIVPPKSPTATYKAAVQRRRPPACGHRCRRLKNEGMDATHAKPALPEASLRRLQGLSGKVKVEKAITPLPPLFGGFEARNADAFAVTAFFFSSGVPHCQATDQFVKGNTFT